MSIAEYDRVARALQFLEENFLRQPSLAEVAASAGLSEFHFQRVFTRWTGVSPKRFLQVRTLEHAKALLRESRSLLDATYEAGLSSPGRLHDLFIQLEAVTPGEYKRAGAGLEILYGLHDSPFGRCLVGVTARGVCSLTFVARGEEDSAVNEVASRWPGARLRADDIGTAPVAGRIFARWLRGGAETTYLPRGAAADPDADPAVLSVLVKGTNFQVQVWQALLRVPAGEVTTYEEVAAAVDRPRAVRAVANAVGDNPIACLIPCHRVIRKTGALGGYRWGVERKERILAAEGVALATSRAARSA